MNLMNISIAVLAMIATYTMGTTAQQTAGPSDTSNSWDATGLLSGPGGNILARGRAISNGPILGLPRPAILSAPAIARASLSSPGFPSRTMEAAATIIPTNLVQRLGLGRNGLRNN